MQLTKFPLIIMQLKSEKIINVITFQALLWREWYRVSCYAIRNPL